MVLAAAGLLLGSAGAQAAPCEPVPPADTIVRLRSAIATLNAERGRSLVAKMEAGLPCLAEPVTTVELAAVYQSAGTLLFLAAEGPPPPGAGGTSDSAPDPEFARYFERAAVLAARIPFDRQLGGPDSPQAQAYAAARKRVAQGAFGALFTEGAVVLDGAPLPAGVTSFVPAGAHLVQEGTPPSLHTRFVPVEPGDTLHIGTHDPGMLAAERKLAVRRRRTALATSGVLLLAAGGLYAAARAQETSLASMDADHLNDEALGRARSKQLAANLAFSGSLLSVGFSGYFAWRGIQARPPGASDPATGEVSP